MKTPFVLRGVNQTLSVVTKRALPFCDPTNLITFVHPKEASHQLYVFTCLQMYMTLLLFSYTVKNIFHSSQM